MTRDVIYRILVSICLVAMLPTIVLAQDDSEKMLSWPQNIVDELTKTLDNSYFRKTQIGLIVYDLTADSVLYAHNEKQLLRPASTMKLLTSITALDRLGSDYCYATTLAIDGDTLNHVLRGDIYCRGGFDPSFSEKDMNAFVDGLKSLGIDSVAGRIYEDLTFKDDKKFGSGWCWDDNNYTLTPLLINKKDAFMSTFTRKLKQQIRLANDTVCRATVPATARAIATCRHSILTILNEMMKESDNLYAESMLYQIAASSGKKNVSASDGLAIVKNLVNSIGMDADTYNFADGSGLSLYNYVSAELECAMLRYAYHKDEIFRYLYPSLPVAGRDGTLAKRMKNTSADGCVHAKTGTLKGVSSLAGYCQAYNGHQLCFAIIDQGVMKQSEAKMFQNRICQILCSI
ncbi:MAG: D-alanyl-D-alanine carboxypeptidase/D-alanyl-D-alanine-endopeptidase [Prevotellaceae bacterium]|nr:D-alanyl-D-alanine carboxypeptidase/D-alanyl-D-alanine-endopeptidase [Prevotellaceae bacterium]